MVSQCWAKKSTFLIYSVPQTRYLGQEYQTFLIWIIYLRCFIMSTKKCPWLRFVTWNYLLFLYHKTPKYKLDKKNLHRSDQVSQIPQEQYSLFVAVSVGGFCVFFCPANSCFGYRFLRLDLSLFRFNVLLCLYMCWRSSYETPQCWFTIRTNHNAECVGEEGGENVWS
jgi:hypothetical protein